MLNNNIVKQKQTSTKCDEELVTSAAAVHWCILNIIHLQYQQSVLCPIFMKLKLFEIDQEIRI